MCVCLCVFVGAVGFNKKHFESAIKARLVAINQASDYWFILFPARLTDFF